jgi:hypothetical protein
VRDCPQKHSSGKGGAPPACSLPHGVYGSAHCLAPRTLISRAASTVRLLVAFLQYHFRLRQPQRR